MKFVFLFFAALGVYAQTLPELIQTALSDATSLAVIEQRIKSLKQESEIADSFANPILSVTTNTLEKREKMHQSLFGIRQKIYFYGKRDAKKKIANEEVDVAIAKLQEAKVELVYNIKAQAYRVWEIKALLRVVQAYIALTQESKKLYEGYSASDAMGRNHMGIMSAELSLSELKIKQTKLQALMRAATKRLEYLVGKKIDSLEINLHITALPSPPKSSSVHQSNPKLHTLRQEIQKATFRADLAHLQNYPDVDVYAAYAYRERYNDYLSFGISLPLPIYGSEDVLEQKAKIDTLKAKAKEYDTAYFIDKKIEELYAILQSHYRIYTIIHDETMPQIEHMLEVSASMIQNGRSLFEYIDVLERKLKLQEQAIDAVAKFYTTKAQIDALKGAMQ